MQDKKYDYKEHRKERELSAYVRPSLKKLVVIQATNELTSHSNVVERALDFYYQHNPLEITNRPSFDY